MFHAWHVLYLIKFKVDLNLKFLYTVPIIAKYAKTCMYTNHTSTYPAIISLVIKIESKLFSWLNAF